LSNDDIVNVTIESAPQVELVVEDAAASRFQMVLAGAAGIVEL